MIRKRMVSMALITGLLTPLAGGILLTASPAFADVSCTNKKGDTAGWIDCKGSGTVKLIIDCKAPQVTDYKSRWVTYNGTMTIGGECKYGINSVRHLVK